MSPSVHTDPWLPVGSRQSSDSQYVSNVRSSAYLLSFEKCLLLLTPACSAASANTFKILSCSALPTTTWAASWARSRFISSLWLLDEALSGLGSLHGISLLCSLLSSSVFFSPSTSSLTLSLSLLLSKSTRKSRAIFMTCGGGIMTLTDAKTATRPPKWRSKILVCMSRPT